MKKIQIAIMAAALAAAMSANASFFDITYTDGGANVGAGQIDVVGGLAISGSFTVTAGSAVGTWNLVPGAGSDGSFFWDSLILAGNPFLTGAGLLFSGTGLLSAYEINMWGNGPGNYSLDGNIGGNFNPVSHGGLATLTAVPEPTTMIAGALLLLPFGASTLRMLRKHRPA
jgi:hypothetical protein